MEIVKKLKGSEPEDEDFNFEEFAAYETEENTFIKKILLSILSIVTLGVIGYFTLNKVETTSTEKTKINSLVSPIVKNKEEPNLPKKAVTEPLPIRTVTAPIKKEKVLVYTEVLALKHKEETSNIVKKESTTVAKSNIKNKPTLLLKKKELKIARTIKPTEKKETTSQSTKKTIQKKVVIQKRKVPKKIVSKKTKSKKKPKIAYIKKGDTLAILSKRFYGNSMQFKHIIAANKNIKSHKTKLRLGQKVIIPYFNTSTKRKVVSKKSKVFKAKTIKIKRGDTLAILAKRYYGNSMKFKQIIAANKSIKSHKTKLKLGQKVSIPYPIKKVLKKRRVVIVKKGYSLAYMAKKFYGSSVKVQKIINANPSIKNKNSTLRIGQKVYLPR